MTPIWKIKNMEENRNAEPRQKMTFKEFFSLGEFWGYFFRKKDPNRPTNFNIRAMHGINKLSIAIFLVAVIYLVLRKLI